VYLAYVRSGQWLNWDENDIYPKYIIEKIFFRNMVLLIALASFVSSYMEESFHVNIFTRCGASVKS
jgi:hypothetical protein